MRLSLDNSPRLQPFSPSPPSFLYVLLNSFRKFRMHYISDILLVDTHPKSHCGPNHMQIAIHFPSGTTPSED
jgi:hypothetical protein